MKKLITKLRKANNMSQEDLASQLGISRPTLVSIEKGDRDITLGELKKLSNIFDIPLEIMLDDELSMESKAECQNFKTQSIHKFHNLILECIKYGSDADGKITKTKLAKLVYLCDFASYYDFLKPISGLEYRKLPQGPVAIQFFDFIDRGESIEVELKTNSQMISLNEQPDDALFSPEEMGLIQKVCQKWKKSNTQEIVDFTHKQIPWKVCREGEAIPYSLIHNEEPINVY